MKKLILILVLFLSACSGNENIEDVKVENEVEYTKETYLAETANDIRDIRSLHDELVVHLTNEEEPVNVAITLMDMSIAASDQSYKLAGTESMEFDYIKVDLQAIQSYVDESYKLFSEQRELGRLLLNETITKLSALIDKLETDFKSVQ